MPDPAGPAATAEHLSRAASDAIAKRRRGRNLAMLFGLLALVVLFYFISLAKLSHPDHPHPVAVSGPAPT
jgi:hypothetical protein